MGLEGFQKLDIVLQMNKSIVTKIKCVPPFDHFPETSQNTGRKTVFAGNAHDKLYKTRVKNTLFRESFLQYRTSCRLLLLQSVQLWRELADDNS